MKEYTLELYKRDRRLREGRRLVSREDYALSTEDYIQTLAEAKRQLGFEVEVHETWVVRRNAQTGELFRERYDTPWTASPASESYWSS